MICHDNAQCLLSRRKKKICIISGFRGTRAANSWMWGLFSNTWKTGRKLITPEIFVDSRFPSVLLFCFLEDFFSPSFSGHS